jgi:hypothetical protein
MARKVNMAISLVGWFDDEFFKPAAAAAFLAPISSKLQSTAHSRTAWALFASSFGRHGL